MKSKDLLSQYLEKNNIHYSRKVVLQRQSIAGKNFPKSYLVNSDLEVDILQYLLENVIIVNKVIAGRKVPKECIPLAAILSLQITEPNIFSKKMYIRLLRTSDPVPKLRSMYIDEAYWFLEYIFKYLKHRDLITHSEIIKMLTKAMEKAHE